MSNGRPFRRQLADLLGPLDGAQLPGGCDTCNAYQTTEAIAEGIWKVNIHHDPDCPTLAAHNPDTTHHPSR